MCEGWKDEVSFFSFHFLLSLRQSIWEQIIDGIVMKALWTSCSSYSHFQDFSSFSSESEIHSLRHWSRKTVSLMMNRERQWIMYLKGSYCFCREPAHVRPNKANPSDTNSILSLSHTLILTYGFTHSVPLSSLKLKLACIFTSIKNFYAVKMQSIAMHCRKQYSTHYV